MPQFLSRMAYTILGVMLLHAQSLCAEISHTPLSGPGTGFILVVGQIEAGDEKTFLTAALNYTHAAVLFKSNGGNLIAGIEIGRIIRMRGFGTGVAPHFLCASACALAWLGGSPRYMSSSSLIGFHAAWVVVDGKKQQTGVGNALVGAYITQLGLPLSAVVYATIAGPDEISWLTPDDAKKIGIDLKVLDLEPAPAAAPPPNTTVTAPELRQNSNDRYYVANTRPPDAFLALRTHPSSSVGQRVLAMPNGTALEILQRRNDGWWYVRVISSNQEGWAKSAQDNQAWILCCVSENDAQQTVPKSAAQILGEFSCDQLWFGRNSILKSAGYCFKTPRAINAFGNSDCRYDNANAITLSPDNRSLLDAIQQAERHKLCPR